LGNTQYPNANILLTLLKYQNVAKTARPQKIQIFGEVAQKQHMTDDAHALENSFKHLSWSKNVSMV